MNQLYTTSDFLRLPINYDHLVNSSLDVKEDSTLIINNNNQELLDRYINDALKKNVKHIVTSTNSKIEDNKILKFKNYEEIFNIVLENIYKDYRKLNYYGITGTNGKTTTGYYLKQLIGESCLFVGTIDQENDFSFTNETHLTTPKLFNLLKLLRLKNKKYSSIVLEVSSHALEQERLPNIEFEVSGFTNLSQDHLDYHQNMENYFLAKSKLFKKGISKKMVYVDSNYGRQLVQLSTIPSMSIGIENQNDVIFDPDQPMGKLKFKLLENDYFCHTNLKGPKAIENFLLAFTMAYFSEKIDINDLIQLSKNIQNPIGRYQKIESDKYEIIVDFAHTPEAIKEVINYAKSKKNKVKVVFGAGGNRDKSKRKYMGKSAALADEIIVSNDNPRNEDPYQIANDILEGVPLNKNVQVILDRAEAINTAVSNLQENEILLILGKGHEKSQEIENEMFSFDDVQVAYDALQVKQ